MNEPRDDAPTDLTYYGGPCDGEDVVLEPGWPPPDQIGHLIWTGRYILNASKHRYEWTEEPMP